MEAGLAVPGHTCGHSCRKLPHQTRQVVEKAPGRPLLFSDTSGSHEAVSGDLFLKKGHLSKNGGSQDSA